MDPFVIPDERLPAGFARLIESPPVPPAEPKPAATAVLMREGAHAPEVLLLKRHRSSGFVPGAYVFPGGRVDPSDTGIEWNAGAPAAEYWTAALREIFEETGVLLARSSTGVWPPSAALDSAMEAWREKLMSEETTLAQLLAAQQLEPAREHMVYIAHWITPVAEPRRYDTRFFLAHLPEAREVKVDAREMVDALWLTPAQALERFAHGALPMVFPTVRTLQLLREFQTVDAALASFRDKQIEPILPRLVRTPNGIGIVVDEEMK
jgi:8-oxo-dGTP pyrophosphatase MutT (NUDIX family)